MLVRRRLLAYAIAGPLLLCLSLFISSFSGCGPAPQSVSDGDPPASSESNARHRSAAPTTPSELSKKEEIWEAYYIDTTKVGYAHILIEPYEEDEKSLVRLTSTSKMQMQRFNQTVTQEVKLISIETAKGQLIRFESQMGGGGGLVSATTRGHVDGSQLHLQTMTLGKTESSTIPWDSATGGFFADRQSLRRAPLKPGEYRKLTALVPLIHGVATVELVAAEIEATDLLDGSHALLRIDGTTQLGQLVIKSTAWVNEEGETLKGAAEIPGSGFRQITYRTTREGALREGGAAHFDLGEQSVVLLDQPLPAAHRTSQIVYRARLREGDAAAVFAEGSSQQVRVSEPGSADITVWGTRPGDSLTDRPSDATPTEADLAANNLIQSQDPAIVAMATEVRPQQRDPWQIACALEQFVHRTVETTELSDALASAAEVARSRRGDCTEHSVLLAALCRARGIPCRVVMGLVYADQLRGFAYHMWNEVWIQDRWIPIDGTLGLGGIGAAHIKVTSATLGGPTPYAELLPVLAVLGKLDLKVISVK